MVECRHCGEVLREGPERIGSRCLRCRMPLYDRSDSLRREETTPADAKCVRHPLSWAIGVCQRCSGYYCTLCRSRWREQTLCLACVETAVGELQHRPEQAVTQKRQALVSLFLGLFAWTVALAVCFPLVALAAGQARDPMTTFMGIVALLSFVPALMGVGQAWSVIRARCQPLLLANIGLCLCCAHLGTMLGVLVLPALR